MINAFHSNWTTPFFSAQKHRKYYIDDFEILTTILSALKWRENNGSIKMVTDSIGKEYYEYLGIDKIWDLGIDTSLDNIKNINPKLYWAAGKIYALKNEEAPIVMMDTDFIVWNKLNCFKNEKGIYVIHKEHLDNKIYPDIKDIVLNNKYKINKSFDYTELPCNTAFVYIGNNDFKNYYVDTSIDFMQNVNIGNDTIRNMVFAEQRLISLCAKFLNYNINSIYELEYLEQNTQKDFTHIWGYKQEMRKSYVVKREFCIKCINRILKDYPEYKKLILNIKEFKDYLIKI
ncbi:MAG: hypothetical protein GX275_02790 [Clostridiales bacterium]|nr:hypothetical protein [Clostridiales bacterium]